MSGTIEVRGEAGAIDIEDARIDELFDKADDLMINQKNYEGAVSVVVFTKSFLTVFSLSYRWSSTKRCSVSTQRTSTRSTAKLSA